MRVVLSVSAAALVLGLAWNGIASVWAQDSPSAAQIIDTLDPLKRGLRRGDAPQEGGGGMARPPQINLSVPFDTGSSRISPAAATVLDQLGQALANPRLAEFKFRLEGHTDTVGSPTVNRALSTRRAASVTDFLATKYKIDRARMTPVGMGQEGLLVETGPGVANAANRRVTVINLGR